MDARDQNYIDLPFKTLQGSDIIIDNALTLSLYMHLHPEVTLVWFNGGNEK